MGCDDGKDLTLLDDGLEDSHNAGFTLLIVSDRVCDVRKFLFLCDPFCL